jgi:pimeloyl-ACP methyl ester carboxylesterase
LKKVYPNADYGRLTLVGHSNGGDISMYLAKRHPEIVKKVVTLDNLRVPFATDGKFKILSFRSKDPVFKADPNVIPDDEICAKAGITVVKTEFQHNDLSDRGPDQVKFSIQAKINEVLDAEEGPGPLASAAASMAK